MWASYSAHAEAGQRVWLLISPPSSLRMPRLFTCCWVSGGIAAFMPRQLKKKSPIDYTGCFRSGNIISKSCYYTRLRLWSCGKRNPAAVIIMPPWTMAEMKEARGCGWGVDWRITSDLTLSQILWDLRKCGRRDSQRRFLCLFVPIILSNPKFYKLLKGSWDDRQPYRNVKVQISSKCKIQILRISVSRV